MTTDSVPILDHPTGEQPVFKPENLLEQASGILGTKKGSIPPCCVLDFDGELIPIARERFDANACDVWSCFHTTLLRVEWRGLSMGLIGGTVGAPFAVLVAEQLIAAGCRHIIGYSSSGSISSGLTLPCLVVPHRALRDEGTSYHYLPPSRWINARGRLPDTLAHHAVSCGLPVHRGTTWTTDAPYRETQSQIVRHGAAGVLTVEMEAAALMALAEVHRADIASLLHVTNALATSADDFHKGEGDINERVIVTCLDTFSAALKPSREGRAE